MKTIGLIGGMSWESSARYYKLINEGVRDKLGELHCADIIMSSMDFYKLEKLQRAGRWIEAAEQIDYRADILVDAGVSCIVICSVTGHNKVDALQRYSSDPILHIADCINNKIKSFKKVGLLGTKYTMKMGYFKDRLDCEVVVPNEKDSEFVNDVIYNELCRGIIDDDSKQQFIFIIDKLIRNGAQAVILGCTEVGLLVNQKGLGVPILDSTIIHAESAVDFALGGEK